MTAQISFILLNSYLWSISRPYMLVNNIFRTAPRTELRPSNLLGVMYSYRIFKTPSKRYLWVMINESLSLSNLGMPQLVVMYFLDK